MISRFVSEKALKILDNEEKAKLLDSFSNFRKYSQIPVIVVFILYLIINYINPPFADIAFIFLISIFLIFMFLTHFLINKKLSSMNLPKAYIKKFNIARHIYNSGFVILGVLLLTVMIL
jgi:hypothetical protein